MEPKRIVAVVVLLAIVGLLSFDARYHFDSALIDLKRQHKSDQLNWSIFYSQENVFKNSGIKYQADMQEIERLIQSNVSILSDLATSYYSATMLPVYVANVHRHQGRYRRSSTAAFLDKRYACYIEYQENLDKLNQFLHKQGNENINKPHLSLNYIIVNNDPDNRNLREDCMAFQRNVLGRELVKLADILYKGEYLDLYQVH